MWVEMNKSPTLFKSSAVILLVRMWVEIPGSRRNVRSCSSSSSWGCELKYEADRRRHWPVTVILLVRMWVEILLTRIGRRCFPSSSSWGCELKCVEYPETLLPVLVILLVRMWVEIYTVIKDATKRACHPPREDVSWNSTPWVESSLPPSSSSWGCELKY